MKLVLFLLCFLPLTAFGQDSLLAPYKRFPTVPPFQILLSDSTTYYRKAALPPDKAVLLMVFSPDCGHCQEEAKQLVQLKDQLTNIQVVLATLHPIWIMKEFISNYGLDGIPNVVVGRDPYYFLPSFYEIRHLPFFALYDRKGNLVVAGSSMTMEKAIGLLGKY